MKKIKIETYKGIDIFYNKDNGVVYFDFEGREREVKYAFEAERIIDEPVWEECDLKGFIIDGTFGNYIGKAIAKRKNKKDGKPDWKFKGQYDLDYKTPSHYDNNKEVFPVTNENSMLFKQWEIQRDLVLSEERKLKQIIEKLKCQTKKI